MRFWMFALALVASSFAVTSASTRTPVRSPVERCLAEAGDEIDAARACIGAISGPCLNTGEGSATTIGMITCYENERAAWRSLRERTVYALRDAESETQIAALDDMLGEYEHWSLARCSYGASVHEGGSLARVVAAACATRIEGELAIDLWLRRREYNEL